MGAFYVFPDISQFFGTEHQGRRIDNADDMAMFLLEEAHVASVSGAAFGTPECIRLSYAAADEVLAEAVRRIDAACRFVAISSDLWRHGVDSSSPTSLDSLPWSEPRVCVVGDVMVDAYMWGHVHRISPEAPVPVVEVSRKEQRVGGAANVVKNLAALGAEVDLISCGWGRPGWTRCSTACSRRWHPAFELDPSRPTTVKTRVISGGHHVVRVDEESTADVTSQVSQEALSRLERC